MSAATHATREAWLTAAVEELNELLRAHETPAAHVRVSVGWPKGAKSTTIGQCWASVCSSDKSSHVFVSPSLQEPVDVLATLLHELVHAADDCDSGHRGAFAKIARALGLEGKLTATVPGPGLTAQLEAIAARLGEYPHAKLEPSLKLKKQTTRMLKCECSVCGYTVRTTHKWIDAGGPPLCPTCSDPATINGAVSLEVAT